MEKRADRVLIESADCLLSLVDTQVTCIPNAISLSEGAFVFGLASLKSATAAFFNNNRGSISTCVQ